MREPFATISTIVCEYTGELIEQGETQYSAHEKIKRALEQMDRLIVSLTDSSPGNLIHPNEKIRNIAKAKYEQEK